MRERHAHISGTRHALVCIQHTWEPEICLCSVSVLVQVFVKKRWSQGMRRCYRSRTFLHLTAGCHAISVMHAHSGSIHGITMQLTTKHAWRCPSRMCQRIPPRMIMHPDACSCDVLPATEPLALESLPPPAPSPPPSPEAVKCPPSDLAAMGWELCSWQLKSPPTVPESAVDLAGVEGMDVRLQIIALPHLCIAN